MRSWCEAHAAEQPRPTRVGVQRLEGRLDPAAMSFPVAERAALRETVYLDENVFRAGERGVEDAVAALAKVQRHAAELRDPRGS